MTVDFSGVVPELALAVERSADVPIGHQLQEALRRAIRSGRLRSGERLPSTRQLADQLGVSRGLVVSAYEQLLAEGYVVSAVGSGTRVADAMTGTGDPTPSEAPEVGPCGPGPCARDRLRLRRTRSACVPHTATGCGHWAMPSRRCRPSTWATAPPRVTRSSVRCWPDTTDGCAVAAPTPRTRSSWADSDRG